MSCLLIAASRSLLCKVGASEPDPEPPLAATAEAKPRQRRRGSFLAHNPLILIIMILLLLSALPTWPYSRSWGYYPTGGLGLVLIIVLILVLMGRI